jgi:DNA-binding TFAR19-related protein (PDSD5 family)
MKVRSVVFNNRRKDFTVRFGRLTYRYPYVRLEAPPGAGDRVVTVYVDPEIGREGFSYVLASGAEGTVHGEQVLDYNRDPRHLREILLYSLTLAAQQRLAGCLLSRRELARRLRTSAAQLYRLLDQTNTRKSVDQMLGLLAVLGCEVDMRVRERARGRRKVRGLTGRDVADSGVLGVRPQLD